MLDSTSKQGAGAHDKCVWGGGRHSVCFTSIILMQMKYKYYTLIFFNTLIRILFLLYFYSYYSCHTLLMDTVYEQYYMYVLDSTAEYDKHVGGCLLVCTVSIDYRVSNPTSHSAYKYSYIYSETTQPPNPPRRPERRAATLAQQKAQLVRRQIDHPLWKHEVWSEVRGG